MFEVLLENNADPSLGLEDTGRNLLHLLNIVDRDSRGRLASKMAKLVSIYFVVFNFVSLLGFLTLSWPCGTKAITLRVSCVS